MSSGVGVSFSTPTPNNLKLPLGLNFPENCGTASRSSVCVFVTYKHAHIHVIYKLTKYFM